MPTAKNKKAKTLERIHKKWIKKCTCTLRKQATQAVPGFGSAYADILFIGEAPGKKEDIEGLPFIGACGKFLSVMLKSIKLSREDVYITSIVKYRPPNNRDPRPAEKEACYEWLIQEINTIEPKLIVFLGRHSLKSFFPHAKIAETHGTLLIQKIKGIKTQNFFSLYHPAAALYNARLRDTLLKDFKKIPKILKKL